MNGSQISVNAGREINLTRRLPKAATARSSGILPGNGSGFAKPDRTEGFRVADDEDQFSRSALGRVATTDWQQKVELSKGFEKADESMGEVNQELEKAKRDLTQIVKIFPPYLHESEDRKKLLSSFRGLRKQIERLTIPPESDVAAEILGGPKKAEDSMLPPEFTDLKVNAGPDGLNLKQPEVAIEDLRDEDLPPFIEDLERAAQLVTNKRERLREQVGKFFGQGSESEDSYRRLSDAARVQLAQAETGMGRSGSGIHRDLSLVGRISPGGWQ